MATENPSRAPSLNEIKGEIADADLNTVSGGDKATTTKGTTKGTIKPTTEPTTPYFEITMQDVTISS